MRAPRIVLGAFSAGLAVGACAGNGWFHCKGDGECVARDDGRCEPDDRCSYPDDECDSRRRYGEWAGELSRTCVEAPSTTTSGIASDTSTSAAPESTTTSSTTDTSSTTTGTSTTSTGGSESTGGTPPQPLGHWPLDDGEDSVTATDIGTGNHAGALVGGEWIEGRIGTGALRFSTNGHGVELGDDPGFALQSASGITMMGWARFDTFYESNASLIAKFNTYSIRFWGTLAGGVTPVIVVMPEGGAADGDTDGPLDPYGQLVCGGPHMMFVDAPSRAEDATIWHHYAGTYDVEGRWLRLYLDGVQICEKDVSGDMLDGPVTVTSDGLQLGRWRDGADTLFGTIDDVRLYDVLLSPEQIAAIANETE